MPTKTCGANRCGNLPPRYSSRRILRSLYNLCRSLGSLRSLYNLGLVVRRAGVFLRSPCRLAEGEDHAAHAARIIHKSWEG